MGNNSLCSALDTNKYFMGINYIFETMIICLILIFAQKAFETWFCVTEIPYGGIICAITWGAAHAFTKDSILTGVMAALAGLIFGSVYLFANRDIRIAYPMILIMFVL